MNMYKLKFTKLQNEIFRLFCIKAGSSLSQREVAKLLGVSPTAIGKSIKEMLKEGLVKIKRRGNLRVNFIELNRDDPKVVDLKRVENLKMIYESGLANFLEEKFPGSTIILFGSYSRGEDTTKSDIDIAIIRGKEKEINLNVFERTLERKIIINFYPSLKEIHKDLRENICNGIVLSGSIQL